jgi:nicotinate-nucleotide adenylyltransferase
MNAGRRVGVLGGTFDPVHLGHLAAATAAQRALHLDSVRFVPSARPPHRPDMPHASGYHRMEMLRRAVAGADDWEVSDLEYLRHGPSYTIDTLTALHAERLTPLQIFFITGADAFADVAAWHRSQDVLEAAHFVVVSRPGTTTFDTLASRLPSLASRLTTPSGVVGADAPRIVLIEADTPNISSTAIRLRAARGDSLDGLVPPAVAAYIAQHSLYADHAAPHRAADAPVAPDSGR